MRKSALATTCGEILLIEVPYNNTPVEIDLCLKSIQWWKFLLVDSCLQTTWASAWSHKLSHTVPHISLWHICTRPLTPSSSLRAPSSLQLLLIHRTPAWSRNEQKGRCWAGQSANLASVPVHLTLVSQIGPVPGGNPDEIVLAPKDNNTMKLVFFYS